MATLIFHSVNKRVARRYLLFAIGGLGISGIGKGLSIHAIWEMIPRIAQEAGLKQSFEEAQPLFSHSIIFSIIAGLLLVMILLRLLDTQFILSMATSFISLTILYILGSLISFLPQALFLAYKIAFILILIFSVWNFFLKGMFIFYRKQGSYVDMFLEIILLGLFLYFMWYPIQIIFLGGRLS